MHCGILPGSEVDTSFIERGYVPPPKLDRVRFIDPARLEYGLPQLCFRLGDSHFREDPARPTRGDSCNDRPLHGVNALEFPDGFVVFDHCFAGDSQVFWIFALEELRVAAVDL